MNNIGVFVDIISIHRKMKSKLNGKLNYRAYLDKISKEGEICRAFAYGAQQNNEAGKFINFLESSGFETNYCLAKRERININALVESLIYHLKINETDPVIPYLKAKVKSAGDIEAKRSVKQTDRTMHLVSDIMRVQDKIDTVVIGSSNSKLAPFIKLLKERGLKVIIFSSGIPYALKKLANEYWEISSDYLERLE